MRPIVWSTVRSTMVIIRMGDHLLHAADADFLHESARQTSISN